MKMMETIIVSHNEKIIIVRQIKSSDIKIATVVSHKKKTLFLFLNYCRLCLRQLLEDYAKVSGSGR